MTTMSKEAQADLAYYATISDSDLVDATHDDNQYMAQEAVLQRLDMLRSVIAGMKINNMGRYLRSPEPKIMIVEGRHTEYSTGNTKTTLRDTDQYDDWLERLGARPTHDQANADELWIQVDSDHYKYCEQMPLAKDMRSTSCTVRYFPLKPTETLMRRFIAGATKHVAERSDVDIR